MMLVTDHDVQTGDKSAVKEALTVQQVGVIKLIRELLLITPQPCRVIFIKRVSSNAEHLYSNTKEIQMATMMKFKLHTSCCTGTQRTVPPCGGVLPSWCWDKDFSSHSILVVILFSFILCDVLHFQFACSNAHCGRRKTQEGPGVLPGISVWVENSLGAARRGEVPGPRASQVPLLP